MSEEKAENLCKFIVLDHYGLYIATIAIIPITPNIVIPRVGEYVTVGDDEPIKVVSVTHIFTGIETQTIEVRLQQKAPEKHIDYEDL